MTKLKYCLAAVLAALLLTVTALAATETDIPTDPPPAPPAPTESSEPTEPTEPTDPTPTPTPGPTPTPAPAAISVLVDEGTTHIYDETGSVMIRWSAIEGANGYTVTFTQSGTEVLTRGSSVNFLEVRMASLGVGTFTVTVTTPEGNRGTCTLRLKNEGDPDPTEPPAEPTPTPAPTDDGKKPGGRRPGGRRPGGFRPGGSGGEDAQEDTGLQVTPGTALSSTHAAGSKNLDRYDEAALSLSAELVTELSLGSGKPAIRCGGKAFTATLPENVLTLTAEEEAAWEFTLEALEFLARSGVTELILQDADGSEFSLDTALSLAGRIYGELRREGYVSGDFRLLLEDEGLIVEVDGCRYRLTDGELSEEAGA